MAKQSGIDISLLKSLVKELDELLTISQGIKSTPKPDKEITTKFILEMSKAAGIAAGAAQEATALIMDINQEIRGIQSPLNKDMDALDKLLGSYGSGSHGGGNGSSFN